MHVRLFLDRALARQAFDRFAGGGIGRKAGVIGRHDRAGRPRFITGEAADVFALGVGQAAENGLDSILVELIDEVRAVVVRHQSQQFGRFRRVDSFDDPPLFLDRQIA